MVEFVVLITSVHKSIAMGVLLIIVIAMLIAFFTVVIVIESQTGFITNTAKYLTKIVNDAFRIP